MEQAQTILDKLFDLIPTVVTIAIVFFLLFSAKYVLEKKYAGTSGHQFRLQIIMLVLSFFGLLTIILSLPISDSKIGQLLSLFGILLSAAIALSATTFVGNVLAGLMLRAVKNFKAGDFIRIGDHFGRVSERGLFHVEIQTEDRDLTTLPNLYLVTNPVKVIRSSGTLVTAEVSLGYDVSHYKIENALLKAAADSDLEEPFVYIMELGDFSVTYRLAGLLVDVKGLLSCRSKLREKMLDSLHETGVEIVSPNFMNQRILTPDKSFIPKIQHFEVEVETNDKPESLVFDKADEAESLEKLRERLKELNLELDSVKQSEKEANSEDEKKSLHSKIEQLCNRRERFIEYIKQREQNGKT